MNTEKNRFEKMIKSTKMSTRMAIMLTIVVALMSLASAFSVYYLFKTNQVLRQLTTNEWNSLRTAAEWRASVENRVMHIQVLARLGVGDYAEKLKKDLAEVSKNAQQLQDQLDQGLTSETDRGALLETTSTKKRFDELDAKLAELNRAGEYDKLGPLLEGEFADVANKYISAIQSIEAQVRRRVEAQAQDAQDRTSDAAKLAGVLVLISVLVAAGMGFWLSRSISRSMNDMVERAKTVAAGDLAQVSEVREGGEIGALEKAMADMQGSLKMMVKEVRHSVDSITVASSEIASGNLDLSNRTEHSAGSLEAAVASISALTDAVRQTADSAREANALASTASALAGKGGSVMQEVTQKMAQIKSSSTKVTEITSLIDSIAHQTNILALNAAVEAAAAGEKGRSFAVVATEVRALAKRSADAAKDIKALIQTTVADIEQGATLVSTAGMTSEEIVNAVQRVSKVSTEISAATASQNKDIESVNTLLGEVEKMTQQNAALVEQSAAAAASLKDQAERLSIVVSRFRIAPTAEMTM